MEYEAIMAWGATKMQDSDETPLEVGYRYYHGLRVAKLAITLADILDLRLNKQLLYVGGFLHDVGKAGYKGPDHGPRGAEVISQEIAHLFEPQELEMVLLMVANHYQRPNSKYFVGKEKPQFPVEVLLVQDADIIDHYGYNAIWLSFHWAARERYTQTEIITRHRTTDTEWHRESYESLNFDASREELKHRLQRMREFHNLWQKEEWGEFTG